MTLEIADPSLNGSIAKLRSLFLSPIEQRRLNGPARALTLDRAKQCVDSARVVLCGVPKRRL